MQNSSLTSVFFAISNIFLATTTSAVATTQMPSVLWIMLDDGRADALGCYGKSWARTPQMDTLAAEGVRFQTAIVQSPVCLPSRHCMKTGLYAHQTGVIAMGAPTARPGKYRDQVLPKPEQKNLLTAWNRRGIIPNNIGKLHAFKKDFEQMASFPALLNHVGNPTVIFKPTWQNNILSHVHTKTHNWLIGGVLDVPLEEFRPTRIGNIAVARLQELTSQEEPFFLRVSFHSPHVGCFVPPSHLIDPTTIDLPFPNKAEIALKPKFERENLHIYAGAPHLDPAEIGLARGTYYGMVALVDDQVGRCVNVLKNAGRLDNTIIVINSDQGFQLGEHGNWKKRDFYDTNVCVPFVIRAPQQLPAKVVAEPVEMIDFVPTLMELCGMQPPTDIRGRSLVPLICGNTDSARNVCFCEHDYSEDMYDELRTDGSRRVMVRTKDWKLVYFMDERAGDQDGALYHLATDPHEQNNLYGAAEQQKIVGGLMKLAEQWDQG